MWRQRLPMLIDGALSHASDAAPSPTSKLSAVTVQNCSRSVRGLNRTRAGGKREMGRLGKRGSWIFARYGARRASCAGRLVLEE